MKFIHLFGLITVLSMSTRFVRGDEGMWLFNNPPVKRLQEQHGFVPTAEWLTHLQQASVRFNSGGSGSLRATS